MTSALCMTVLLARASAAAAQAMAPPPLDTALHTAADIRAAAEYHVVTQFPASAGQKLHASAGDLDARLRLPRCETMPTGLLPNSHNLAERITVGVTCSRPKWTVYVQVRIETEMQVLVATRAVPRNAPLGANDVETRTLRVPGLAATYITSEQQLAGRHLRKPVAPGTPISVELLAEDVLVRRGQRVTLVASVGGVEVRAQGEAVSDSGPGGRVRVLNLNSRRVVEGQAESREQVRVSL